MSLQAFGKRLAQLRREKAAKDQRDLDRRDIAKAIGCSPSSITRWEAGEVWPGEDAMGDLAKFFGVTRAWLRYGEEAQRASKPPADTPRTPIIKEVESERDVTAAHQVPAAKRAGGVRRSK